MMYKKHHRPSKTTLLHRILQIFYNPHPVHVSHAIRIPHIVRVPHILIPKQLARKKRYFSNIIANQLPSRSEVLQYGFKRHNSKHNNQS